MHDQGEIFIKLEARSIKIGNSLVNVSAFGLIMLLWFMCRPGAAQVQVPEFELKAVFIEKITQFVEWPKALQINESSKPFIFGVVGTESLVSNFKEIYSTKTIRDKKVEFRHIINPDEISGCHLIFIAKIKKDELVKIISYTKKKPILTISDTEGFAQSGVHINFIILNKKLRFEINETEVRESGLTFSYLLLQLAKIVNPVKKELR